MGDDIATAIRRLLKGEITESQAYSIISEYMQSEREQALCEQQSEIVDWLGKTADDCPYNDALHAAAQTALRTAANELSQWKVCDG